MEQHAETTVVAEAGSGEKAVPLYAAVRPDIVLMDMRLPGEDGVKTLRRLLELDPGARVVMLSAFDFDAQVVESMRAGARGFLSKDLDPDELFRGIDAVQHGGTALSPYYLAKVMNAAPAEASRDAECLSPREVEVLSLVAKGCTNRQIAETLVISPSTVKAHLGHIMGKLGFHNRVELASYAVTNGLAEG